MEKMFYLVKEAWHVTYASMQYENFEFNAKHLTIRINVKNIFAYT